MNRSDEPTPKPRADDTSLRARFVARLDQRLRGSTLMPRLRLAFWAMQDIKSGRRPCLPRRTRSYRIEKRPFGVTVSGYLTGEFGIGEAARGFVRALEAAQIPHALLNYERSEHSTGDTTFETFSESSPYLFNLVAVNADVSLSHFRFRGPQHFTGHFNIGLWFWELEKFPAAWRPVFNYYHEIWTTSDFCARAIGDAAPIPVIRIPHPLVLDTSRVEGQRADFGIPEDAFAFVFSFDYLSVVERKNPAGAIEAFRRAFGARRDVVLVLKSINAHLKPAEAVALHEAARGLNVLFLDHHLRRHEVLNLFDACDCLLSLHRSEGLGLGMAEAMLLGKPVIATAYSGNTEFMNEANSFLVKYRLVELTSDLGSYERGNVWAQPDLDDAAAKMSFVVEHHTEAARRAVQGRHDVESRMNARVAGNAIKARLELLASTCRLT